SGSTQGWLGPVAMSVSPCPRASPGMVTIVPDLARTCVRGQGRRCRGPGRASTSTRYRAAVPSPYVELEVGERVVRVTNPDKVYFPARGETKLDLVRYYLAVADGIVRALYERPTQLRRFPDGVEGEAIYQKRVPEKRPDWIETARVRFPSGRHADELCVTEVAQVAWAANLGTVDFHPCPSRRRDTEHPDELRIDVDPQPGTTFA